MSRKFILSCVIVLILLFSSCNDSYIYNDLFTDEDPYIYSDHYDHFANEKNYKTILGDLSKVKIGEKSIALQEEIPDMSWVSFDVSEKGEISNYDMRWCDVSSLDLKQIENYNNIYFNSQTIFPQSNKMPERFNPEYILELNKNPGLGIRELHNKVIIGKDIGIAIIDDVLFQNHEQYKNNLVYYERIHSLDNVDPTHGPAVASIAVGKDTGVAPGAKLYYIATTYGHIINDGKDFEFDASIIADCILRVLEINQKLSENEKIRVISISRGYDENSKGYEEIQEAIKKADRDNIFVITTTTKIFYKDFQLFGMNKDFLADPDDFNAYFPAKWYDYSNSSNINNTILFPMSRTYASCNSEHDYEINYVGGLSWAVPWCAGFYALCCQVKPEITPHEFIDIVNETSIPAKIDHDGETYNFGKIANPMEVVKILQRK